MTKNVDWLLVSVGEDRELAMDALHFQAQAFTTSCSRMEYVVYKHIESQLKYHLII